MDEFLEIGRTTEYSKKHTSPATLQSVVTAPPNTDSRYVLDLLLCGGDANGSIQIYDSDDTAIDGYFFPFGANGGIVLEKLFLEGITAGKGFKYSTLSGGNHTVIIKYHLENHRNT